DLIAIVVVTAIATLVSLFACRKELRGMPAQTLRPKSPKAVKPSAFERTALWKAMGFVSQWNIRDVRKNKLRTLMGVIGVAGSMMLLICAFGCRDSMNYMPKQMFEKLNLNERTIVFEPGTDAFTVGEYARKYGGQQIQTASVELVGNEGTKEQKVKSATLTVVDSGGMMHFQDYDQNEIRLAGKDVLINTKMAELLDVQPGEIVRFKIVGDDKVYRVRVTGCNRTPTGQGITMSTERFRELGCDFEPNQVLTNYSLPDDLVDEDEIQAVQDTETRQQEMLDSLSIMNTMIVLMISVAVMLGLVVLYNLSELSFVEKVREYTTLKVLGLQERVIRGMILTQNLIVGVIGVIAGIPLGRAFTHAMFSDMGETQDMVEVITVNSYLTAAAGAIVIALTAGLMMSGRIKRMNMVDALKSNE
ncbi:MAG: ABC transporter permease, partial [Lachnospiraceae bacterium]